MDCHDVTNSVNLLIDGEISGEEKEALLQHLEKCRECLGFAEAMEKLKLIVRAKLPRKATCPELQKQVLRFVEINT